jgi:hypothetical protein
MALSKTYDPTRDLTVRCQTLDKLHFRNLGLGQPRMSDMTPLPTYAADAVALQDRPARPANVLESKSNPARPPGRNPDGIITIPDSLSASDGDAQVRGTYPRR